MGFRFRMDISAAGVSVAGFLSAGLMVDIGF